MAMIAPAYPHLNDAVERAVGEMLRVQHWGTQTFVSTPIFYPSGSPVTVRVSPAEGGFRIDDGGFAYRELESVGFERSFASAADKARQSESLDRDRRCLFTYADAEQLSRAISDVALASWNVADRVFKRIADQEERDIEEYLRGRLVSIFGASNLEDRQTISGSSTNPWDVSAIIQIDGHEVVFQAVSDHANSVYRTSTAFHDLAALPHAPKLISVVKDKASMGRKLIMLSQAGRVIQSDQADVDYLKAAA
ncbi:hypothetical protein [Sphingomonas pokkalii]|uniref:hypothetical protein n=1 Tax=Sphingomonas pokkalii TaxID=2175090 RepID=UPI001057F5F8|nr:hypothetical protein [Sphingomonas pokkalii]